MNSKSHSTTEISAVQRRFLHLFAMNDTAGISGCYTQDAQMLVANMDVIRGRAAIESVFKFTAVQGHTLEFQTQELVRFQLINTSGTDTSQAMLLGARFAMPIAQVAIDATPAHGVAGVIGIGQSKALHGTEVCLDQIEPRSLGGGVHGLDLQAPQQRQEARIVVQVVQVIE